MNDVVSLKSKQTEIDMLERWLSHAPAGSVYKYCTGIAERDGSAS
jgi:hypothetical protein